MVDILLLTEKTPFLDVFSEIIAMLILSAIMGKILTSLTILIFNKTSFFKNRSRVRQLQVILTTLQFIILLYFGCL